MSPALPSASTSAAETGRWSLQRRLALAAGLGAAMVLAGTAAVIFFVARAQMIADYDKTWRARGDSVTSTLEYHKGRWDLEEHPEIATVFAASSRDAAYHLWVGTRLIARSRSLNNFDIPYVNATMMPSARWATLPDNRVARLQTWTFTPYHEDDSPAGPDVVMVIISAAEDLQHAIASLAYVLIWATALGAIISAALMAMVVRRAMRPLQELGQVLAERAPGSAQAVVLHNPPQELSPVLARLNEAFSRLDTALLREKNFTADAAHELRTPLAALRLLLEVSLNEKNSADGRRHDVSEAHVLALQLQHIVDALLALARLDRGLIAPTPARVVIKTLVDEVWSSVNTVAVERHITCRSVGLEHLIVTTDQGMVQQILLNLCDNAVSHGDANSEVVITGTTDGNGILLTIVNQASQAPADLSHAGQRLWRADPARQDGNRHIGIGLSLCKRIANVLGGDVQLEQKDQRVTVTLHLADLGQADT